MKRKIESITNVRRQVFSCTAFAVLFCPLLTLGCYFSDLNQKALTGDVEAQKKIVAIFHDNENDPTNMDEAIRCEIAASAGNAEAQHTLGWFHWRNDNFEEGIHWLEIAAEQEYVEAQMLLSKIYQGRFGGIEENLIAAEKWLLRGVKAGSSESRYELGCLYRKQKEYTKAFAQFKVASEMGYRPAKSQLARCYLLGKGTSFNPVMSVKIEPYTYTGFGFLILFAVGEFVYGRRSSVPAIVLIFGFLGVIFLIGSAFYYN